MPLNPLEIQQSHLSAAGGVPASVLKADFCIVGDHDDDSGSPVKYVVRWRLEQSEVKGLSLSQSREKFDLHESEWDILETALERADYSFDSSHPKEVDELDAYRRAFLETSRRMKE